MKVKYIGVDTRFLQNGEIYTAHNKDNMTYRIITLGMELTVLKSMCEVQEKPDQRYLKPKPKPTATKEEIDKVIASTEIYKQVSDLMHGAQREQIAYGMGKYPEPLNADTWTIIETIDHILGETIDKLHYLTMLKLKFLEQEENKK